MPEYKLAIVTKEEVTYPMDLIAKKTKSGNIKPVTQVIEKEVCVIGYFKTERELRNWAGLNFGEIDKC